MREHLLKIRPKNEIDEQQQLEVALELSRKQAEIEENQRYVVSHCMIFVGGLDRTLKFPKIQIWGFCTGNNLLAQHKCEQ